MVAMPEEKAIVKPQEGPKALATAGPVMVDGLEGLDEKSDYTMPRVRLLQSLSAEVAEGTAKAGTMRNSLTGEDYGEKLQFIPVQVFKSRIRFDVKELKCRSNDGRIGVGDPGGDCAECPYGEQAWKDYEETGEAPECNLVYNYPSIILVGESGDIDTMPTAVALTRTSVKAARKLNTMLRAYARSGAVYELCTVKRENEKGKFYVFDVKKARGLTAEEREAVNAVRQMLAGKVIVVDESAEDAFVGNAGCGGDSPNCAPPDDDQPF